MNYSLGNMLGGAGALNADKLSLDLQFATDKTLTARKGPTPTFTRASTATFVGSNGLIQSAAINAARFDHDPVTLACKGLLIEEARTNLILNSGNATLWTFSGTNEGSLTAPDGTSNGLRAGLGTTTLTPNGVATVSSTAYTMSVFLKRDNTDWIRLQYNHAINTNTLNAWFNLSTGQAGSLAIGVGTVTSISSSITNAGNGWYRCTVTGTVPSVGTLTLNVISATADSSVTRVAGSIYGVWGAQLEAGSFPTSYIPTVASSVVRSADVCSITGASFTSFYNQSEGTVIVNGDSAGASGSRWCGTGPIRAFELYGKTSLVYFESSGVSENTIGAISLPTKFGLACKLNDFQGVRNGTLGGADTNATMPSPTTFHIGNLLGASSWLNGCIVSIRYYRKRLTNAKLQSLTAP